MDDVPNPTPPSKIRSKQFEQNAESIFILPGLELRFQTRQLEGNIHPCYILPVRTVCVSRTSALQFRNGILRAYHVLIQCRTFLLLTRSHFILYQREGARYD